MGSLRQKQTFSSTTPHFFYIILEETSRDIKIQIPKKFVIKYGAHLSNSACLKLPSGEEWQVEFTRCNGTVWLEKGWSEFSKFLSLDYGDFLVFRYEGNSVFQVCICDKTATEIEYPVTMAPRMDEKDDEEDDEEDEEDDEEYEEEYEEDDEEDDEDDDISIEILEDSPPHPKKREKSPLTCPPPNKKFRTIQTDNMIFPNDIGGSTTKRKCLEKIVENVVEFRSMNNDGKTRAVSCSDGFITPKDAHFRIVVHPSYVQQNNMRIPIKFLRENQIAENNYATNVTLRISTGKTWCVKFKYFMENAKFGLGWLPFVKDNCLKVGDVCVFILIKDTGLSFQVEIFRGTHSPAVQGDCRGGAIHVKDNEDDEEDDISIEILEDPPPHLKIREKSPLTSPPPNKKLRTIQSLKADNMRFQNDIRGSSTKQKCLEKIVENVVQFRSMNNDGKARAVSCSDGFITPKDAHFRIVVQPSYVQQNNMGIPVKFLRENQIAENNYAANVSLRISTGKTWSVKFRYYMPYAKFGNGWLAFVKDNCIKVGDVCVFILIKDTELSFQVEIFRATDFPAVPVAGDGRGGDVKDKISSIEVESEYGIAGGKHEGSETGGQVHSTEKKKKPSLEFRASSDSAPRV